MMWAQETNPWDKPVGENIVDAVLELNETNTSTEDGFSEYYDKVIYKLLYNEADLDEDGYPKTGATPKTIEKINIMINWVGTSGSGLPGNVFTVYLNSILQASPNGIPIEYIDATKSGLGTTFEGRFLRAASLKTIKLPKITSLHNDVFNGLTALEYLQIGDWKSWDSSTGACPIENIGDNAFRDCSAIKGLNFEVSGTVGNDAFRKCSSLTAVPVKPAEGKTLKFGSYVLGECAGLTEVTIPENVDEIGENAFNGCENLKKITLSSTVTSVKVNATAGCENFTGFEVAEGNKALAAEDGILYKTDSDESGNITLTTLIVCPMTKTIDSGYNNWISGVDAIGEQAFYDCTGLSDVKLPEGVKSIAKDAFLESSIKSLDLPSTVNSIDNTFVNNCPNLTKITVAEGNGSFKSHGSILYKGNTTDGFALFSCPSQLSDNISSDKTLNLFDVEKSLGGSLTALSPEAFNHNKTIETLILPDNVENIPDRTFNGCVIKQLSVPYSLDAFGVSIMVDCNDFSKYLAYEESQCYKNTTTVGSITYYTGNKFAVDNLGILYDKEHTTLYSVPAQYTPQSGNGNFRIYDNIRVIHSNCFQNTQNIKDVFIPQGIMAVPHQCFMNSKVEKVTIPNSVVQLGQDMFTGCSNLKDVYFLTTSSVVPKNQGGNDNVFWNYNPPAGAVFHFSEGYDGLIDAYKDANDKNTDGDVTFKTLADNKTVTFATDIKHRALFEDNVTILGFEYEDLADKMENQIAQEKYSAANIRDEENARNKLDGGTQYEYITLYRDFETTKEDEYNTLALPFSLTRAQVKEKFGEGTKMYKFIGRYGNTIKFETVELTKGNEDDIVVKKGVAVLIKPTRKRHSYLFQLAEKNTFATVDDTEENMTETSIDGIDKEDFMTTEGNNTRYENGTAATGITFTHAFYATYQANVEVGPYFYYVTADGKVGYATKKRNITKAFRGFIFGNEHDGTSATAFSAAKVNIDIDGVVTGLDEIKIEGVNAAADGNVYSIDGRLVSRSASSLSSLPKGLYIVNGKKVAVK